MWKTGVEVGEDFRSAPSLKKWRGFEATWKDIEDKEDGTGILQLQQPNEIVAQ